MPIAMSLADIFSEWHDILAAFEEHADQLAAAEPLRADLEASLRRAEELRNLQVHYTALKQQTTQDLRKEIDTGRERARRAQSVVKALIGTDSEGLMQFKVAPRRKRGPRKRKRAQPAAAGGAARSKKAKE